MTHDAMSVNIRCGLSTAFRNKENMSGKRSALGYSFNPVAIPADSFVQCILAGKAFTPGWFSGSTRKNETFISSELIVLDYDHNVSVADLLGNPFIRAHAMLIYSTPSSRPECYKTRAVFRLTEDVETPERYRALARAWAEYVGLDVDPASWKPAQPYYGSTNRIEQPHVNLEALLPTAFVGALTADHATDDYLRETARLSYTPVDSDSPRAEAYAAATVQGALDDYVKLPARAKVRHDAFIKLAARLIGMKLGNWPGLDNVDALLRAAGHATDRPEREITDAISWAYKTVEAIPLALPEDSDDSTATEPQPAPDVWFKALPDSWRSAYLNYYTPSTVCIVELFTQAVAAGQIDPTCFTVADLMTVNVSLGFGISQPTLYRGVEGLIGELFSNSASKKYPLGTIVADSENNSGRGRKPACYRLLPIPEIKANILANANPRIYERAHETDVLARPTADMMQAAGIDEAAAPTVAAELDAALADAYRRQDNKEQASLKRAKRKRDALTHALDEYRSTQLPAGWPLGTASNYRAAFLHATVKADPQKPRSRQKIADLIGVHNETVTAVRRRAGLKPVNHQAEMPVTSAQNFEAESRKFGRTVRGRMLHIVSRSKDGEKLIYREDIERELKAGAEIVAEFQLPNTHEIVREAPPEVTRRQPREHVEPLHSRPAQRTAEPKPASYYGRGYDPGWVIAKLKLGLKLATGQLDAPDDPRQIIEIIIGRPLTDTEFVETWDGFLADAIELGAEWSLEELVS